MRPTLMAIEAQDVSGASFTTTFGAETVSLDKMERVSRDAMIASHEIDHLDGRMLVDRLSDEAYELANHVSCFFGSGGFLFIFLNVVHGGRSFAL